MEYRPAGVTYTPVGGCEDSRSLPNLTRVEDVRARSAMTPGVRRLQVTVGLIAAADLGTTLPGARGHAHYIPLFAAALPLPTLALSVVLAAWRAWRVPSERAL